MDTLTGAWGALENVFEVFFYMLEPYNRRIAPYVKGCQKFVPLNPAEDENSPWVSLIDILD